MIEHINPPGLSKNPAFTNVIMVKAPAKTIYIGGQNAVDAQGNIIGSGDIREQTKQVFKNIRIALEACSANIENIVKWTIYVVQGQSTQAAFEVFQEFWGDRQHPPTISVLFVSALAHPEFLVEIEAIAVT